MNTGLDLNWQLQGSESRDLLSSWITTFLVWPLKLESNVFFFHFAIIICSTNVYIQVKN